jgi:hypothetical protein|tara:strand:+ start:1169 stop:1591 length:423 start_codon:yes stop_codon:yes gene_type:complete
MKNSKAKNPYDLKYHKKLRERKDSYILGKTGGRCELCTDHWPSDVLCFHHLVPEEKEFGLAIRKWADLNKALGEAKKCAILCMNCHALEHKALKRGETLINDNKAYLRYRNHRFSSYKDLDDRNEGSTEWEQGELPFAPI